MLGSLILLISVTLVSSQFGCKFPAFLSGTNGTFSTPYYHYYPDFNYPANLKCRWIISVPEGKNTRLEFSQPMELSGMEDGDCSADWVAIFRNVDDSPTGQQICDAPDLATAGPYCPMGKPPAPIVISGSNVTVDFCTNFFGNYQGFELTYSATDEVPTVFPSKPPKATTELPPPPPTDPDPVVCGGNITLTDTNSTLYIESPNYPGNYPARVNCTWYISGLITHAISITAEVFGLESGQKGCEYDALTVIDLTVTGSAAQLGKFCGRNGPDRLISDGKEVMIVFHSDYSGNFEGFRLRIQKSPCLAGLYGLCPNTGEVEQCFQPNQLCDGRSDCPKATDEFCPAGCGTTARRPLYSTRIVGGLETIPHSWPWQVAILSFASTLICGGTIIDHHWVVTAAHCCDSFPNSGPRTYKVRVGEHDLNRDLEANAWTYELEKIIRHPSYRKDGQSNDLCLLKTKMPILFNNDVYPICLGSGREPPVGTDCYITGWGSQEVLSEKTAVRTSQLDTYTPYATRTDTRKPLQQVDVRISSEEDCKNAYFSSYTEDMMCAYNLGKDSCTGDSGGPLVCPSQTDPNVWELVGVTSFGRGCAVPKVPGVYARTAYFLDWIAETVLSN